MRGSLKFLALLFVIALCGCAGSYYPARIAYVNAKLLDSNASSVRLGFDVYVKIYEGDDYDLTAGVQLLGSRISILEKSVKVKGKGSHVYRFNLTFDRDKNYTVVFRISKKDIVYDTYPLRIANLQMVPNLEFGVRLRNVDFQLVNVSEKRATLLAKFYFVSNENESDVDLHVKVKPVGTSLIVAEKWIGRVNFTKGLNVLETNLTVPKDYNYLTVVEAWKGDVIESVWKRPLILNPEKPKPKNETRPFSLKEFVVRPMPRPMPYTPKKIPAFLSVTAIACLILLSLRRVL